MSSFPLASISTAISLSTWIFLEKMSGKPNIYFAKNICDIFSEDNADQVGSVG